MPHFAWNGYERTGAPQRGFIEAGSRSEAMASLRAQGLVVTELKSPREWPNPLAKLGDFDPSTPQGLRNALDYFGFTGVPQKALAIYVRKFAQLLRAGVGYTEVFDLLGSESENPRLRKISREFVGQVGHGATLTTLFAQHPAVFPRTMVAMLHAGEVAGRVDVIMEELAGVYDKEVQLRASIMQKLYYPIALLCVAMALIAVMIWVVPGMIPTSFEGQQFLAGSFRLQLFVTVIVIYGLIGLYILWCRTKPGYLMLRVTLMYVPYLGVLLKKLSLIRFSRMFAAMFASGVPILEALEVSREAVVEPYLKSGIERAGRLVNQGHELTDALAQSGVFPNRVLGLVRAGERAGELEAMMLKIAEYYESEAESQSHVVATAGYFAVYLTVAITVAIFIIGAWQNYFNLLNSFME